MARRSSDESKIKNPGTDQAREPAGEPDATGLDKGRPRTLKEAIKHGRLLQKGVRKFLRYNRDLIPAERLEKIASLREDFDKSLGNTNSDLKTLDHQARDLTRACEVSVPNYSPSLLRENIEVIFVAFVIAMGIRAYFLQPFKIPTGSMQPTLNGVLGFPPNDEQGNAVFNDPAYEPPALLRRAWERIWNGRRYVNVVAESGGRLVRGRMGDYAEKVKVGPPLPLLSRLRFLTKVQYTSEDGTSFVIPSGETRPANEIVNPEIFQSGGVYREGQVIARGYVQTGDQVLVDKFSYHWVSPGRSNVFVFTTKGLPIAMPDPRIESQHYIKRLAGVPGDKLDIDPPRLVINGGTAEEFGFRRVMSREDGYSGYLIDGPHSTGTHLGPDEYFALGDNSRSSADGRRWGTVPKDNIVGRAVFVYWPFGQHFGPIR